MLRLANNKIAGVINSIPAHNFSPLRRSSSLHLPVKTCAPINSDFRILTRSMKKQHSYSNATYCPSYGLPSTGSECLATLASDLALRPMAGPTTHPTTLSKLPSTGVVRDWAHAEILHRCRWWGKGIGRRLAASFEKTSYRTMGFL